MKNGIERGNSFRYWDFTYNFFLKEIIIYSRKWRYDVDADAKEFYPVSIATELLKYSEADIYDFKEKYIILKRKGNI